MTGDEYDYKITVDGMLMTGGRGYDGCDSLNHAFHYASWHLEEVVTKMVIEIKKRPVKND